MRLTREKVNLLSHQITEKLASIDEVEFIEDRNTIRLAVVDIFMKWLKKEEEVDKAARQKIESQKRTIPEGSGAWRTLCLKCYEEKTPKIQPYREPGKPIRQQITMQRL